MLKTYSLLLTDSLRLFKKNVSRSPLLYALFFAMAFFSVVMISSISLIFVRLQIVIAVRDLFFVILGIFLLKTAYDFYRFFITNEALVYALSTQQRQAITVSEMILTILWSNLGLWALLSGLYTLLIFGLNLSFDGVEAYLLLTYAVALASILGVLISFFLFSNHRLILLFMGIPFFFLWQSFSWIFLFLISIFYLSLLWISFRFILDSYLFQHQKNRSHENERVRFLGSIWSVFTKESLFLWRERLLISIIFSASFLGISTGYLSEFGQSLFLPDEIRVFTMNLSSETYAFVGIYVLVVYASVFITLNLFLNEENKVWLIKLLPVSSEVFVWGKIVVLFLSFLASIPFLAFFLAFTKGESAITVILLFIFSFLSGIIISAPLGSKYIGGSSDVLLLYSVSLLMLLINSMVFALVQFAFNLGSYTFLFLLLMTLMMILLLFTSVKISAVILKQAKTS